MDKSNGSQGNRSYMDQNSLGILNMDNLKVFGDLSSFSKSDRRSTATRDSSSIHERLREERLRALETLEKPRPLRPSQARSTGTVPPRRSSTNISELVTDETIDLNSSGSFALATPAPKGTNISFEPAEITGRSTLCKGDKHRRREKPSLSVAEILKSSFVEKARQLEKKLQDVSQLEASYHLSRANSSSLTDSFSCSRSLPRTADMSDLSLNGGGGISFGSASLAAAGQDESFAPAELMQSKLVLGEISWAQEFTAMPTATLSNQAMQKIAAPPPTSAIETSVSNSVLVNDPDFSLGNYFQTRSENIWNIVTDGSPDRVRPTQALIEAEGNKTLDSVGEKTPQPDNKTYTKSDANVGSNLGRNLMQKMQKDRIQTVLKASNKHGNQEPKRSPSKSEILSLSAIDKALRDIDLNSDTSTVEVVNHLWEHGRGNTYGDEENKENRNSSSQAERTLCGSNKLTDTMSFTDSVLNSTDFRHLQQSISRKPLSPLADQPQITISRADTDPVETEGEADIDEWPSTPVKEPNRRVRRTKISPRAASPASSEGVRPLTSTEDENEDEDKTPVNQKKRVSISTMGLMPRNPSSLSSTRLDGCDVAVASSTERSFGISPNLAKNLSPMSSPRSCVSSPLLDSTTNSERRQLMNGVARKANSSQAGSEASSTSGFTTSVRRGPGSSSSTAPRSMSRCSNSSEFSHRDGKLLPLKVTHTSLCWGSTKLRTDVRKSMQVKNTADKRLVIRLGIQGPGFQLVGGDSNTITLQAMECRSVVINFCPTVCGAAIGSLSFYAPAGAHNSTQPGLEIPLYGYGGSASITIQGLLKGPVGASFLTIGDVCELSAGPLSASLRFHNKGPLTAFVGISVDSTVLMKLRLSEAFEVRPSRMILPPNSEGSVQILFRPNREDLKNILKKTAQVLTLANMRIFCGDEPNRQRMRSLVQRMSSRQREKLTSPMLDSIWGEFPDEQPVRNIGQLNEPPEFILDLVTVVRIIDVALTLNRDFDESSESSLMFLPEAEETVLFRTICVASSPTPTQSNMLEPVDELLEADTTTLMPVEQNWSVEPASLEFGSSCGSLATLAVTNCFRSRQLIEVSCSVPDLVRISPTECYAGPDGGQAEIDVRLLRSPRRDLLEKEPVIVVSMENERINVPLSFKF
ncbi:serine-rich adhesin for platelets [Drosophila ficusphila]|uniref:serine-rich adhesin for platelets n=1 Tax=Drosophila ficusphila TaxID=30025 RepID=UPI0007E7BD39|nr:serine-rich adhesin for platelets [Drosophila ficusphila]